MNIKELNKIAKACRKAGIKSYKCADFEFTLSDEVPVATRKQKTDKPNYEDNSPIDSDTPSDDALLFWSADAQITDNQGPETVN